jgi:hypothetical protein
VSTPIVGVIYVGHRRRDSAFCHYRMRFPEERFANNSYFRALRQSFESGAQTGAPGADY